MLKDNEIVVNSFPVKYHDIEYHNEYIVVTQNRIRRRVYNGYFFEDTGVHIYLNFSAAQMFQHKKKPRKFILNTETKEFRDYSFTIIEKHTPDRVEPVENNTIQELKK
jgi:hypothetical protein